MKTASVLASVAGLAIAGAALAQGGNLEKDYSREHVPALPLADHVGGVNGVTTSTIFVPDAGLIDTFDYVFVDISHTWIGDLIIQLEHGNNVVRLINRPGFTGTGFGSSSDLAGVYTFVPGGPAFQTASSPAIVPPGAYGPFDSFDAFHGKPKEGEWTLRIIDHAGGDTGVLRGWGFGVTNVPTPGAAALLGLGGLIAARRRRA